ncbi:MAG: group III truncated hemoglobin [Chitinophagales bacterium]|jgi:hemoglobin|nr:group III truncated hemoglobin [Chitinophagales bacterium]
MKKDIYNREDVELLVDTFYDKVKANATIGYIFNDIAKVDWENHLPLMYSFWASILLGEHSFSGNPMYKHIQLSKIAPMTDKEFSEWLKIFIQTTDELFEGEKAEEAKTRASNIARLMLHKINTSQPN